MSGTGEGGKTPDPNLPDQLLSNQVKPGQTFADVAMAANLVSGGLNNTRTFEQIISEEKQNRNILELYLTKNVTFENNKPVKPKNSAS